MTPETLLKSVKGSLAAITAPRFFETERGYQGQLLVELHARLPLRNPAIVEQEYQKQAGLHRLTIRPDIIIHEPFDPQRHAARTDGNFAVMELKCRATAAAAVHDFRSLGLMLNVLRYRIGFFINIDACDTHANLLPEDIHERVVCLAVKLRNGVPEIIEQRQ
jgi:hypothetical protein